MYTHSVDMNDINIKCHFNANPSSFANKKKNTNIYFLKTEN
jgi:hypothetical protein